MVTPSGKGMTAAVLMTVVEKDSAILQEIFNYTQHQVLRSVMSGSSRVNSISL